MAEMRQWTIQDALAGAQQLNQQLAAELTNLRTEMYARDEAHLRSVIDALINCATMAQNGSPQAQNVLRRWRQAMEAVEQAPTESGLAVVRSFRSNGQPRQS